MTALLWTASCLSLLMGLLMLNEAAVAQGSETSVPDVLVLMFRDFFKLPIGRHGPEPTDTLLQLRDQRVRVQGHMVKEEEPRPGVFMLTATPVALGELADGPADYLPAATLFVHSVGEDRGKIIGYRPGTWTVTGVLRLGPWQEANDRMSYVRLILEGLASITTPDGRTPTLLDARALNHSP